MRGSGRGKEFTEYLRVNTNDEKGRWYPRSNLGVNAFFNKVPREKGRTYAQYQIPGKLTVMPRGGWKGDHPPQYFGESK